MNAQEREVFWKTLCEVSGINLQQDIERLIAAIKYPQYLYRYRSVTSSSLEALRTNKLYFSSANYYDDPFDTFLHIDIECLKATLLTAFQTPESTEAVVAGIKDI